MGIAIELDSEGDMMGMEMEMAIVVVMVMVLAMAMAMLITNRFDNAMSSGRDRALSCPWARSRPEDMALSNETLAHQILHCEHLEEKLATVRKAFDKLNTVANEPDWELLPLRHFPEWPGVPHCVTLCVVLLVKFPPSAMCAPVRRSGKALTESFA